MSEPAAVFVLAFGEHVAAPTTQAASSTIGAGDPCGTVGAVPTVPRLPAVSTFEVVVPPGPHRPEREGSDGLDIAGDGASLLPDLGHGRWKPTLVVLEKTARIDLPEVRSANDELQAADLNAMPTRLGLRWLGDFAGHRWAAPVRTGTPSPADSGQVISQWRSGLATVLAASSRGRSR